jgi:diguanylate cyclase (GGDEF)-like protein
VAPRPASLRQVAVVEAGNANQSRAVAVIEGLGYDLVDVDLEGLRRGQGPPVLVVGIPGGEELIQSAGKSPSRPVLVVALPGPAATARDRCEEIGADLFAVRPLSSDAMSATLHAASQVARERERARGLHASEEVLRQRLQRYGQADTATGFQHFDFFRRILVMELKRAKRYGYSLAVCLVAIDPRKETDPEPSPEAARKLRTRVAAAISASIRDIDLPIDYADDRMLVFLPYTDIEGATRVGQRVAGAVRSYGTIDDGERQVSMSVSVGIAALRPGKPVSFARLMTDAGAGVRAAQLKGGARVVVRK